MLVLGPEEAEDAVKGSESVGVAVIFSTLATEPDAGVEIAVFEVIPISGLLEPTGADIDETVFVAVVPKPQLSTALVLVALPPPSPSAPTASLYALSAAPSALLTAVSDILSCVPPHAVRKACNGAVKNSG